MTNFTIYFLDKNLFEIIYNIFIELLIYCKKVIEFLWYTFFTDFYFIFQTQNILIFLIFLNIFFLFLLFFIAKKYVYFFKKILITYLSLFYILVFKLFNEVCFTSGFNYKYIFEINWVYSYSLNFNVGVDNISVLFIFLTSFLILVCILTNIYSMEYNINYKDLVIILLLIKLLLILTFTSLNILIFFIFYESVLFPMFFLIGIWGSRKRRIRAAYFLLMYTIFGSIFMLLSILYIFNKFHTVDLQFLYNISYKFTIKEQIFLFLGFFIAFAIKIPMLPTHIWLPEAHVEAPTTGSIILAGLLLKLGGFGMLKFCLLLFPDAIIIYNSYISMLAILGIVYTSFTTIRQIDLKKIIAYSSIGHMNLVVLGLFSFNVIGYIGAIFLMISHGFISSCLFFLIGCVYDRYKTRNIKDYSGLVTIMPNFVKYFFLFILGNISFPGTSAFIAEFLLLNGIFSSNFFSICLIMLGIFLTTVYSIWLFNRISFGSSKIKYGQDLLLLEKMVTYFFIFFMLIFGFFPNILINILYPLNFIF